MEDAVKRDVVPPQPSLLELAAVLVPWVHILQIRLTKSSIQARPIAPSEPSPLRHTFDATTAFSQEDGKLRVHTFLTVSAGDFLQIEAEFLLDYSLNKEIPVSEEIASAFGKMNGIYNAWPYWREYVQSVSARAGMPPLAIPLMTTASMLAYYTAKEKTSAIAGSSVGTKTRKKSSKKKLR
jgi:hypothetical protein